MGSRGSWLSQLREEDARPDHFDAVAHEENRRSGWLLDTEAGTEDKQGCLATLDLQQDLAQSIDARWVKVLDSGVTRHGVFAVYEPQEFALWWFIRFRHKPQPADFARFAAGVVAALIELRDKRHRPHGNLSPETVFFHSRNDRADYRRPLLSSLATDSALAARRPFDTDQHAIGVLLYQFVRSHELPAGAGAQFRELPDDAPFWSDAKSTTDKRWRRLVGDLLSGDYNERTLEEMLADIRALDQSGPNPLYKALAAAAAAVVIASLGWYFLSTKSPTKDPPPVVDGKSDKGDGNPAALTSNTQTSLSGTDPRKEIPVGPKTNPTPTAVYLLASDVVKELKKQFGNDPDLKNTINGLSESGITNRKDIDNLSNALSGWATNMPLPIDLPPTLVTSIRGTNALLEKGFSSHAIADTLPKILGDAKTKRGQIRKLLTSWSNEVSEVGRNDSVNKWKTTVDRNLSPMAQEHFKAWVDGKGWGKTLDPAGWGAELNDAADVNFLKEDGKIYVMDDVFVTGFTNQSKSKKDELISKLNGIVARRDFRAFSSWKAEAADLKLLDEYVVKALRDIQNPDPILEKAIAMLPREGVSTFKNFDAFNKSVGEWWKRQLIVPSFDSNAAPRRFTGRLKDLAKVPEMPKTIDGDFPQRLKAEIALRKTNQVEIRKWVSAWDSVTKLLDRTLEPWNALTPKFRTNVFEAYRDYFDQQLATNLSTNVFVGLTPAKLQDLAAPPDLKANLANTQFLQAEKKGAETELLALDYKRLVTDTKYEGLEKWRAEFKRRVERAAKPKEELDPNVVAELKRLKNSATKYDSNDWNELEQTIDLLSPLSGRIDWNQFKTNINQWLARDWTQPLKNGRPWESKIKPLSGKLFSFDDKLPKHLTAELAHRLDVRQNSSNIVAKWNAAVAAVGTNKDVASWASLHSVGGGVRSVATNEFVGWVSDRGVNWNFEEWTSQLPKLPQQWFVANRNYHLPPELAGSLRKYLPQDDYAGLKDICRTNGRSSELQKWLAKASITVVNFQPESSFASTNYISVLIERNLNELTNHLKVAESIDKVAIGGRWREANAILVEINKLRLSVTNGGTHIFERRTNDTKIAEDYKKLGFSLPDAVKSAVAKLKQDFMLLDTPDAVEVGKIEAKEIRLAKLRLNEVRLLDWKLSAVQLPGEFADFQSLRQRAPTGWEYLSRLFNERKYDELLKSEPGKYWEREQQVGFQRLLKKAKDKMPSSTKVELTELEILERLDDLQEKAKKHKIGSKVVWTKQKFEEERNQRVRELQGYQNFTNKKVGDKIKSIDNMIKYWDGLF